MTNKKRYKAFKLEDLIIDGFFKKVNKNTITDCWEWIGPKHNLGYGKFSFLNGTHGAHRVSWMLFKGTIPEDKFLCHKCDNPCCVNPDHLFLGSPKENTQDMIRKKRKYINPALSLSSEKSLGAKLTNDQAIFIRKSSLRYVDLARMFNVSSPAIRSIKLNKSFRDIL